MFRASHKQWEVAIQILINTSALIKFRIVEMDNWLNLNKRSCWDSIRDPFAASEANPWTTGLRYLPDIWFIPLDHVTYFHRPIAWSVWHISPNQPLGPPLVKKWVIKMGVLYKRRVRSKGQLLPTKGPLFFLFFFNPVLPQTFWLYRSGEYDQNLWQVSYWHVQ